MKHQQLNVQSYHYWCFRYSSSSLCCQWN